MNKLLIYKIAENRYIPRHPLALIKTIHFRQEFVAVSARKRLQLGAITIQKDEFWGS